MGINHIQPFTAYPVTKTQPQQKLVNRSGESTPQEKQDTDALRRRRDLEPKRFGRFEKGAILDVFV